MSHQDMSNDISFTRKIFVQNCVKFSYPQNDINMKFEINGLIKKVLPKKQIVGVNLLMS